MKQLNQLAPSLKKLVLSFSYTLAVFTLVAFGFSVTAQNAGNYAGIPGGAFTAVSGSYVSIASTGTTVTYNPSSSYDPKDEGGTNPVPIGFNFTLFGTAYNYCTIYANGYLSFAATPDLGTFHGTFANANTANSHPIIAPYWADIEAQNNAVLIQTTGSSPNRVFTVEWPNMGIWKYSPPASYSMQVKLYEANGQIEFVYDNLAGAQFINASIGLSNSTTNFLGLDNTSAAPTPSVTTAVTTVAGKPATGQIYRFVPPPANTGTGLTFGTFSNIQSNQITLNWSHTTPASTTFYKIQRAVSPFTNFTTVGTVPAGVTTFTNTGLTPSTQYQYRIVAANEGYENIGGAVTSSTQATLSCGALTGTVSIGTTGTYNTITQAIVDIGYKGVAGNLILELQPSYTSTGETFPINFTDIKTHVCTNPNATITLRPHSTVTDVEITTSIAATINLNGCDYFTIDGRPGGTGTTRALTISNGSALFAAISLTNDAIGNNISWCNLRSNNQSTTSGTLLIANSTATKGNDSNNINNCYFSNIEGQLPALHALTSIGQSTTIQNNNNSIDNNWFNDFELTGVNISGNGNGANWQITNNSFYDTTTSGGINPWTAISFSTAANSNSVNNTISLNYIGGNAPLCGGTHMLTNRNMPTAIYTGILYSATNGATSTIYGNTIKKITLLNSTDTGSFRAIFSNLGTLNIDSNIIGDENPANFPSIMSFANSYIDGINISATAAVNITRNKIAGLRNTTLGVAGGVRAIVCAGTATLNINNNVIKNLTTNTPNTSGTNLASIVGIASTNSSTSINISNNTVGGGYGQPLRNGNNNATAGVKVVGIVSTAGVAIIENNIVSGLMVDSTIQSTATLNALATINGIVNSSTVAGQLIQNNQINSLRITIPTGTQINQMNGIAITGSASTIVNGNNIYGLSTKSGYTGSTTSACLVGINASGSGTYTITANTIDSVVVATTTAASTQVHGIILVGATGNIASNNIIKSIYSFSTSTTVGMTSGIYHTNTAALNVTISGNRIYNLSCAAPTSSNHVVGIFYAGSATVAGNNNDISRNFIHSFRMTSTSTAANITGIYVSSGIVNLTNNMIRCGIDSLGNRITTSTIINGILSATTSGPNRVYHNNVYCGAAPASGTSITSVFHASSATPVYDIKNNIFYADTLGNGTGARYALRLAGTANVTSNNNILYSPKTTTGYVVGVTTPAANYNTLGGLTGWKYVGKKDLQSASVDPNFVNHVGTFNVVNLRVQSPTPAEGNGSIVADFAVLTDVDGNTRGGLSAVDIGASAGNYTLSADSFASDIIYTPLANTMSFANRTIQVNITDANGIYTDVVSGLAPKLYFRKGLNGTMVSTSGTLSSGNSRNGIWQFTVDNTPIGGAITGDTIFYFIAVQDSAGNLVSNPANIIGTDVNTIANMPTALNSYKIVGGITTTVTVGPTGTYPTLTGTNGLFNAINNNMLVGNTLAELEAGTINETGSVQLNQWLEISGSVVGYYGYTLTIQPQSNSKTTLEGNFAGGLITLNGADRVKFRGISATGQSTDTNLVIRNNAANAAVLLQNDAVSNSFNNVVFESLGSTFSNSATSISTGNDNLSFDQCYFRSSNPATAATTLFTSSGTAGRENDTLLITNSHFSNFTTSAITVNANHGDMLRIKNNSFFGGVQLTAATITINFIPGATSNFDTISGNFIGGTAPMAQGTPFLTTNAITGITQSVGTGTGVFNANNVIKNINQIAGSSGIFTGIAITGGSGKILNNTIGDSVGFSINSALNSIMTGIITTTTAGVSVNNNIVTHITNTNISTAARVLGITSTSGTNATEINNNLIQNFIVSSTNTGTTTACVMLGISNTANPSSLSIQNNKVRMFTSLNNTANYQITGIINTAGPVVLSNNMVEDFNSSSASIGTTTACAVSGIINSSTVAGLQITNNLVRYLTHYRATPVSSQMIGILASGSASGGQIAGNTVYSLTTNNININALGTTCALIGISYSGGGSQMTFSRNKVYAIQDTSGGVSAINVIGMYYSGSTAGPNFVTKNLIHSIGLSTTGIGSISGLHYNAGTSTIANNMIRVGIDSAGVAFTGPYNVYGMFIVPNSINNYFHNSVYVGGQPASGASTTAAININANANNDATKHDSRNNIFYNAVSNNGGTGTNYAVRLNYQRSYVGNYNIYYAPGAGGLLIGTVLTTAALPISIFPTLRGAAGWNYYTEKDINSGTGNPEFLNPTGTALTVDLRLSGNNPCESSGDTSLLVAVPDDIDGNLRANNSHADIGANAGNFNIAPDLFTPQISYNQLGNSGNLSGPYTLTDVLIKDKVGIQLTGANAPRLYYQKGSAGAWHSVAATSFTGTSTQALFNFSIDYTPLGGVVTGDVIYYYVIAQDSLGSNVTTEPVYSVATSVNIVTSPTFSPNFFNLLPSIPANAKFYVGTGQQFTSLTDAGGLFALLNANTINGHITAVVTSDLTETGANQLTEIGQQGIGAGTFTVTIRPDSSATTERVISGSALNGLIVLNGADGIKFNGIPDGSSDTTLRLLRFRNNNTGPTINYTNDATGNTIRNCAIEGINTLTGLVFYGTTAFPLGNSNDTVTNCVLNNNTTFVLPAGVPNNLIHCASGSIAQNNNIVITNNRFFNFGRSGISADAGIGTGWVISGNHFYNNLTTPPSTVEVISIRINGAALSGGHTITHNFIGGQTINAGGAAWQHTIPFNWTGILYNGNASLSTISNNTIKNVDITGISVNSFFGINAGALAMANISNNTIGDALSTNNININFAGTHAGINVPSMTIPNTINISNNTISGILVNNPSGAAGFSGISVAGGIPTITNNTIGSNTLSNSISMNGVGLIAGINASLLNTQNATIAITGNTVANLTCNGNNTSTGVCGIIYTGTATPTISNNVVKQLSSQSQNNTFTGAMAATGIAFVSTTAGANAGGQISGNTVNAISAASTAAVTTNANGIAIGGAGVNLPIVFNNRVFDISNASSSSTASPAATANGIYVGSIISSLTIRNNRIALGDGYSNNAQYNGIWQTTSGSFSVENYHNTIVISGTNSSGSVPSFAYHRGNNAATEITSTVRMVNNALINSRTGGSAKNYAVANETSGATVGTGWAGAANNYNLLSSSTANTIGLWGSQDRNFALWQISSASNNNSWSVPTGVGAGQLNSANLFTNNAIADLTVRVNNTEAWYLNGKGIAGALSAYTLTDFDLNARDTTFGLGSDIGSDEFVPTSIPPMADTTGAIAGFSSTQFTFAGRTIATINWIGGTLPTNVVLRYYTGANPPNAGVSTRYYNGYWNAQFTGGGAYNYDLVLNYDAALIGSIANENDAILSNQPNNGLWNNNFFPTLNVSGKTISSGSGGYYVGEPLVNFSISDFNAPLPVTLTAFTAKAINNTDVELKWATASETNNKGFEVERSIDGVTFKNVGFVKGAEQSKTVKQYRFIDANAFTQNTTLYYRLKQVDFSGRFTTSDMVQVSINSLLNNNVVVYPNPFNSSFRVNINATQTTEAEMDIVNLHGVLMHKAKINLNQGSNIVPVNALANAAVGIYFIRLNIAGETRTLKLVKTN